MQNWTEFTNTAYKTMAWFSLFPYHSDKIQLLHKKTFECKPALLLNNFDLQIFNVFHDLTNFLGFKQQFYFRNKGTNIKKCSSILEDSLT